MITVAAPAGSPHDLLIRSASVELSLDGVTWAPSVDLVFTAANWNTARTVFVRAIDDLASENTTTIALRHQVIGQRSGTVAGAGAATLTSAAFAGLGDLVGARSCWSPARAAGSSRSTPARAPPRSTCRG